jgi:hypothetical protein
MRILFTCPCGNKLEIEAETWFAAQKAAEKAGWKNWPDAVASYVCPECLEMPNENSGIIRESRDL